MPKHNRQFSHQVPIKYNGLVITLCISFVFALAGFAYSQNIKQNDSIDNDLINQYIRSKGTNTIVFDSSNIKQFWVDRSVLSQEDCISIALEPNHDLSFESCPLKIKLINVNETQDCTIDVITNDANISFSLLDSNKKSISIENSKTQFIQSTIVTSLFHLEDTQDLSFFLKFNSKNSNSIQIKKIILSFSSNSKSSFFASPGKINFTKDNLIVSSGHSNTLNASPYSVTGKRSEIRSTKKILLSDKPLSSSVTVKNVGNTPTRLYTGYIVYSQEHIKLDGRNYPYSDSNMILNVVSSSTGTSKVIVDSYPAWKKNCHIAFDVKEDMSDIPNVSVADGKVVDIKKVDDSHTEITLDKPLKAVLVPGTKVRINGMTGMYLYTKTAILKPGQEQVFTATIQKDNSSLEYSSKAFPRGAYYVVPVILSYSSDVEKENTITIKDYVITF